jgi:hypothetical protein
MGQADEQTIGAIAMSPLLEDILKRIQQLTPQEQLKLAHLLIQALATSVPKPENPWLTVAGSLVDDPFFEEYIGSIQRYRQEIDAQSPSENLASGNSSAAWPDDTFWIPTT